MIAWISLAYPDVADGRERCGPTGLSQYGPVSRYKTRFLSVTTGAGEGSGSDTTLGSGTLSTLGIMG